MTVQRRDILAGERERTLAMAVRKLAGSLYNGTVERAFEHVGCSCNPYRERLQALEGQYNAERQRLEAGYRGALADLDGSDLGKEITELKSTVRAIDYAEHPTLDAQGRQAYYFLSVWMMDQIRQGDTELLGTNGDHIAELYAQAWFGGWRPKSLRTTRSRQSPRPAG